MRKIFLVSTLCFLFCLVSCDTSESESIVDFDNSLLGKWSRTDEIPSGGLRADFRYFDMVSTYVFNNDTSYTNQIDFYGFKDENPEEIIGQSETIGIYEVRGDSIFIIARQNTSWEKGFNPEPTTVQYDENDGYGSRFEIMNNKLTLFYLSAPFDLPIPTQITFDRVE